MQAINDNDNENQDPIQELPNEMFTSILSHLPPSSIALSSAASRPWRDHILSDPRLHQEIDLTKLKEDQDLLPITYHFVRLSFLSLNRLTKVSLNMTPFLKKWIENEHDGPSQRFEAYDILLTTLQQSQKTLKEITLLLDGPGWSWNSDIDILPFLLQLLRSISNFNSLKSIWLEAPVWFSLKAGNSGGKKITVRNVPDTITNVDSAWSDGVMVAEFIQEVKRISGSSLTEFLPNPDDEWPSGDSSAIIEELLDCSSLERLNVIYFFEVDKKLWDLIFRLRSLRYLVSIFAGDADDDLETLQAPPGFERTAELVNLDLYLTWVRVDWDSISKWAGDALENLMLSLDSQSMNGINKSMIINSMQTLKELQIARQTCVSINATPLVTEETSKVEPKLFFPNLERLYLGNVEISIFQLFSNVECSKLQSLNVFATHPSLVELGFNCLIKLLETHDSQIFELELTIAGIGRLECPQPYFNFNSLETIQMGGLPKGSKNKIELPRWLLTSLYPNLSRMRTSDLSAEQFQKVKSNLKAEGKAPKLQID